MQNKMILTVLIFLLILTAPVLSQTSVRESFDYAAGSVLDDAGMAGNGGDGSWFLFDSSWAINDSVLVVGDTGIVYDDLDYMYNHTGMQVNGRNRTSWGYQRYGRYLDTTWPDEEGAEYWISAFMQIDDLTSNQSWTGIGLYDSTSEGPLLGKGWGSLEYTWGQGGDNPPEQMSGVLVSAGPQWLAAKMVMSGDTMPEQFYMWVSPDPAEADLDTADAHVKSELQVNNGFNRVVVHFGGEPLYLFRLDEIRLGTSYQDVAGVIDAIDQIDTQVPDEFVLQQNYPNPFNPSTNIVYSLRKPGHVTLTVYDILGHEVAVIVDRNQNSGTYEVDFSGADLSSGVYFYQLKSADGVFTKKMALLK